MAEELEEINQLNFIVKGTIVIGYELNNIKKYCIKYQDSIMIGAYECMFDEKSYVLYTAFTNIEGYFIRKTNWFNLCQNHKTMSNFIRRNVLLDYMLNIKNKITVAKKKAISMMKIR